MAHSAFIIKTINPLKLESFRAGELLKFWRDLFVEAQMNGFDDFEIVANEDDCWDVIGVSEQAEEKDNSYPRRVINKVMQVLL